jgi:hypothetical protein
MCPTLSTQAEEGQDGHDDHHQADKVNDAVHETLLAWKVLSSQNRDAAFWLRGGCN